MTNPYVPWLATIAEIVDEAPGIKSFRLVLKGGSEFPPYRPGQFAILSVFGVGECPISISSTYGLQDYLEFSVKEVGRVTGALHQLDVGYQIGLRGPFGNSFLDKGLEGKNLVTVGGGIGLPPLRSLINYVALNPTSFGGILILYGARTPPDLVYKDELARWGKLPGWRTVVTVDREYPGWEGRVGLVPVVLKEEAISPQGAAAVVCGPPIMIKFTVQALLEMGFTPEQIVVTLERKMQCGIGKCGRCNIGPKYVCLDGPVFTYAEIKGLPVEY